MSMSKQRRSCADACYKFNSSNRAALGVLERINETLTDEIDAGLIVTNNTIDALNDVKRTIIIMQRSST